MNTQQLNEPNLTPVLYASLGRRLLAFFIDSLILIVPLAIAARIIPLVGGIIVLFFYGPVLEASELRATLGKYLCGIQVTDVSGRRISLRAAVIRNLLKYISTVLLFIGFIFALFSAKKQALHDMLADTLVAYGRSDRPIPDAWLATTREVFNFASSNSTARSERNLAEIERLHALKERGALTEEEFQAAKRKILSET